MDPKGKAVLYMALDIDTTLYETHAYFEGIYSVAEIEVLLRLKIVDLSKSFSSMDNDYNRIFSVYLQEYISQGNTEEEYLFPQMVAAYCEKLGYDGIGFRSRYIPRDWVRTKNVGINYAIFNYKKCEAINSKLYEITLPCGLKKDKLFDILNN